MEHILRLLARHGFDETIANLHWFPELIEDHFGDGSGLRRRAHLQPRGAAARHLRRRPQRRRLPRRLLPRHLRRRAHRHRPDGDARVPRVPRRDRDPGDQAGRRHQPVRRRDHRRRRPHPGLSGEAGSRRSALRPRQLRIYMFRSEIFDFFPAPGPARPPAPSDPVGFADWAMDVFPRLLEGDVPFYSHEIDAYWNDIGNLEELREGTLDALSGAVEVEREGELVDGSAAATPVGDEGELARPGPARRRLRYRRRRPHRRPLGDRRRRPDRRRLPPARSDRAARRRDPRGPRCWSARSPASRLTSRSSVGGVSTRLHRRPRRSSPLVACSTVRWSVDLKGSSPGDGLLWPRARAQTPERRMPRLSRETDPFARGRVVRTLRSSLWRATRAPAGEARRVEILQPSGLAWRRRCAPPAGGPAGRRRSSARAARGDWGGRAAAGEGAAGARPGLVLGLPRGGGPRTWSRR